MKFVPIKLKVMRVFQMIIWVFMNELPLKNKSSVNFIFLCSSDSVTRKTY